MGVAVLAGIMRKVRESDRAANPWLFGPAALILTNVRAVDPVPATGALGLFRWSPGGALETPAKWMVPRLAATATQEPDLFGGFGR